MTEGHLELFGARRLGSLGWLVGVLICFLTIAGPARAGSAADKAAAEALFDKGVALLKAGEYEAACEKLEDSHRVDPGIGTLLYLADCYEKTGRTASAWATFREAASLAHNAGQQERAQIGNQRADRLEGKLSRLTIEVAAETQALAGLEVWRGQEELSKALLGTAVPVDPGEYAILVKAPGHIPFREKVTVAADGASETVSVPPLRPDPAAEPSQAKEAKSAAGDDEVRPPSREPASGGAPEGKGLRTAAVISGSAGIVAWGVGSVFGLMAIDKNNQAFSEERGNCGPELCPPGPGVDLIEDAYDRATISTIAFAAGGALVASGIVLYLVAPEPQEKGPRLTRISASPSEAGGALVELGGSF